MAYTQLQKFVRRLSWPREKRRRFYNRYCTWNVRQISRGNFGRQIPLTELRDSQLAINKFNKGE